MKKTYIIYISTISSLCITMGIQSDPYTDRLIRITNTIANAYDGANGNPNTIASAALQALDFVIEENNLTKNSPMGKKNKYITICAEKLQKEVQSLSKITEKANDLLTQIANKTPKAKIQYGRTVNIPLVSIQFNLDAIKKEIAEIPKKQFLPLSKVQKDLTNLLDLVVRKNIKIIENIMSRETFN